MSAKPVIKKHTAKLTPASDSRPEMVRVDDAARLREIWKLVEENNKSVISTELIVCQIYMESRFDKNAQGQGSSARGLMQILQVSNRELYRLENLKRPRHQRKPEPALYREADAFHASAEFLDEATNIQVGTKYLQALIDKATSEGNFEPVVEAYKDYRGVRNGIYYKKIKLAAEKLKEMPNSMQPLRKMEK